MDYISLLDYHGEVMYPFLDSCLALHLSGNLGAQGVGFPSASAHTAEGPA